MICGQALVNKIGVFDCDLWSLLNLSVLSFEVRDKNFGNDTNISKSLIRLL